MPKEGRKSYKKSGFETKGGFTLESGTKGILVTCHRGKEIAAQSEILKVFEEFSEQLEEFQDFNQNHSKFSNIEDELENELLMLKKRDKKLFSHIQTGIDCTVFIRVHPSLNPSDFIHKLLSQFFKLKVKKTRFCSRLIPLNNTCFATMREIKLMAEILLKDYFESKSSITYSVVPKIRNNSKIIRDELITNIASLVPVHHVVNLSTPSVCIIVEILNNVCGISIVSDYQKLKRYNVEQLLESEVKEKPESKLEKA
ncbi:hypothetical protein HDV02_004360 [Globomyces sp. JEL0801]|nr:hypothetical protein HDV02_004360 [Globomyces sp. JEL0801]